MKLLAAVVFMSMTGYRSIGQKPIYDALTTIRQESAKFTDSLLASGVDTLISYYAGSAACPAITPVAIIYWALHDTPSVMIFKETTKYKKKKPYTTYQLFHYTGQGFPAYACDYFEHNFDKILSDSLPSNRNPRGLYVYNYTFEAIRAKIGNRELKYLIKSSSRENNYNSHKIAFIDNFRSFIPGYFYQ